MDIQSLESLVRAYIAHVVAEATLPLIRRIESLEAQVVGFSDDIREAVEACVEYTVEAEVESEVERRLNDIEVHDADSIERIAKGVIRDVISNIEV